MVAFCPHLAIMSYPSLEWMDDLVGTQALERELRFPHRQAAQDVV